ncbi:kinase-like protein [Rickenella mellea]|uniref:non-specific serine/threonine protein kinase n=1 Tax=Rickenella mellea TaxID=50990 RepID=A0A4Y7QK06_9AGAM|nr:kinase-like protein [Rickenella mellea]
MEKAGKELTPKSDGKKISQHITGGFPSFTNTETITKRKKDSERDGSPQNKRSRPDDTPINQSKVKKALSENGYQILEEEEVEGWTRIDPLKPSLCRAKSRNGDVVVVKLLKKNSVELDVLRSLNHNKSEASHVVELLDSLHLDIGTVIILPLASPLRCTDSSSAHCLIYQLIEAVSFIHGHGVAHLDLKPSNILVSHAHGLPYLVVIDFSVSVFASSPDFQIEGFVGTPHWTAPEIGTFDGPPQTYSPIRADLWSCGNMMKYIADQASIRDPQLLQLAEELLSSDPLKRPLLGKESNTFHTPQPKRKCFTPDHFQGTVQKRHCAFHCENRHWEQGVSLYG